MKPIYSKLQIQVLVLIILVGLFSACKKTETEPEETVAEAGDVLTLKEEALQSLNLKTEKVDLKSIPIEFSASGEFDFNEKKLVHITSKVSGWVEKINAFLGDRVRKEDTLVTIYSTDYLSAQSEFIQAEERLKSVPKSDSLEYKTASALFSSAKVKLLLLGASESETEDLANNHQSKSHLAIRSPLSGTVIESNVITGNTVNKGDNLFTVSDLSSLWVIANVYETDIALVKRVVGRNGAGKTTTMESIMGFLPVRSGRIVFHGEEVTALPVHQRARRGMGYAPEGSEIFPELTVAENMMISRWMSARADVDERAFSVFPEVRELLRRQGMNLSGGQRKMVAIARGMALAPTLLLLDEAFEGLAPVVVKRFRDAVLKIEDLGISLLIAESNLVNAARIADPERRDSVFLVAGDRGDPGGTLRGADPAGVDRGEERAPAGRRIDERTRKRGADSMPWDVIV